ncbi:MAG: ABC transporter permease subunit [Candidatus Latescibacteria bacterium]|jgi:ABC-type transport system involved in multi-copper enzyme maturation permease subunit|nr:ABC transporter permease subunit [Candidatus Latescibacterota bacterium]
MLGTIIIREIQEYIKSKKLLIWMLVTIILVTITTVINIEDYAKRQQDYLDAKREMGKWSVFRPPQVLSILALGKDQKLGNRAEISSGSIAVNTTGYMGSFRSMHEKYLSGFGRIDFVFIVRFVLSMMVIFLAFNAVSQEKEQGTLKLMMANNLPRSMIILGKYFSGFMIILIPLLVASFISLLIMAFHTSVSLDTFDWIRIIGIIGASMLYLSAFYTMSLFVSILVKRSSIALMILLQIWIFLVIIYPNASTFIADKAYTLPNEGELNRKKNELSKSYIQEGNRLITEYAEKNPDHSSWDYKDPLLVKRAQMYNKANGVVYSMYREHGNKLRYQAETAQTIAILSPAVLLDKIVHHYARTDLDEYERFLDGIYNNWQTYRQFTDNQTEYRERLKKMPEFTYPSKTIIESFYSTADEILILFLLSLTFFCLAYSVFLKKDIR